MFKRKKFLAKLKKYGGEWDTHDYAFVKIEDDGRLIPTNNFDLDQAMLNRKGLFALVNIIENNT